MIVRLSCLNFQAHRFPPDLPVFVGSRGIQHFHPRVTDYFPCGVSTHTDSNPFFICGLSSMLLIDCTAGMHCGGAGASYHRIYPHSYLWRLL
jgi:hypothetical protein